MVDPDARAARGGHRQRRPPHPARQQVELAVAAMQSDVRRRRPGRRPAPRHPDARRARPGAADPARRAGVPDGLPGPASSAVVLLVAASASPACVLPVPRRGAGARGRGRGPPARRTSSTRSRRSPGATATSRRSSPRSSSTRSGPHERGYRRASCRLTSVVPARDPSLTPMANDTAGRSRAAASSILVVLALVVGLFCLIFVRPSTASTGPDQVSLHYKGGAFTSKRFSDCIAPVQPGLRRSRRRPLRLPAPRRRNFVFDTGEGDGGPITFVTKDGIEMTVEGVANFLLNTDCSRLEIGGTTYPGGPLQRFHELIGNRYAAYMTEDGFRSDGWRQMLRDLHRPAAGHRDRPGRPGLHLRRALHRPGEEGGLGAVGARPAARPRRPADRRRDPVLPQLRDHAPEARAAAVDQGRAGQAAGRGRGRQGRPGRGRGPRGRRAGPGRGREGRGPEDPGARRRARVSRATCSSTPSTTG